MWNTCWRPDQYTDLKRVSRQVNSGVAYVTASFLLQSGRNEFAGSSTLLHVVVHGTRGHAKPPLQLISLHSLLDVHFPIPVLSVPFTFMLPALVLLLPLFLYYHWSSCCLHA